MSTISKQDSENGLTITAYVLLAQLSLRPWSTYELAQQRVRYFRFVWPRAESAIYREVKQLAARGLTRAHTSYTGKRKRTIYEITDEGIRELRGWLATPVSPFSMDFEAIIRLLVSPLGTHEQLIANLHQVQSDAEDMLGFAGEVKQEFLEGRNPLQNDAYLRALAVDFFVSLLNTVHTWTQRTLSEVERWPGTSLEQRNERGIEILKNLPVGIPEATNGQIAVPPSSQTRRRTGRRAQDGS